jgi:hypothetical protein
LHASDGGAAHNFGGVVVLAGDRLAAGALGAFDAGLPTGAVYVFERAGGTWTETAKIAPSLPTGQDFFGDSIALEGNRLAVGASLDDTLGTNAGAAYVFGFDGNSWQALAKLTASAGAPGDNFGDSVALDEGFLAVGGVGADGPPADSGAVWVFRHDGERWQERARIRARSAERFDFFGAAAALDAGRLLAGTPGDNGASGSAWVLDFTGGAAPR